MYLTLIWLVSSSKRNFKHIHIEKKCGQIQRKDDHLQSKETATKANTSTMEACLPELWNNNSLFSGHGTLSISPCQLRHWVMACIYNSILICLYCTHWLKGTTHNRSWERALCLTTEHSALRRCPPTSPSEWPITDPHSAISAGSFPDLCNWYIAICRLPSIRDCRHVYTILSSLQYNYLKANGLWFTFNLKKILVQGTIKKHNGPEVS
jgi:hypothetical protein